MRDILMVRFVSPSVGFYVVNGSDGTEGIHRTTDAGATWVGVAGKFLGAQDLAGINDLHFASPQVGAAVGFRGILVHTADGGATWSAPKVDRDYSPSSGSPVDFYSVNFVDPNTGWASGTEGTVLKTTDGGSTWTTLTTQVLSPQKTTLGSSGRLHSIRFFDATTGFVRGTLAARAAS